MLRLALAAVASMFICAGAFAQDAVTATCKDGTDWSGARRSGACRGHGGVQAFGAAATTPAATGAPAAPTAVPTTTPSAPPRAATNATASTPTPASGGGPGQVWVNTASHVYHCQGDRYYGNTKRGSYMTEAAAKAAGDHPDHGKACS